MKVISLVLTLILTCLSSIPFTSSFSFSSTKPFQPSPYPNQPPPPYTTNNYNHVSQQQSMSTSTSSTSSTSTEHAALPTAEADRAFRYATSLEQAGMTRTAHAAYHEAATLYHCFLDSTEFSHVTDLSKDDDDTSIHSLRSFLAYSCIRLAFLSHDALSDPKAALRLYKEAAILDTKHPSIEAYDGIGTSTEASHGDLKEAVEAYRTALSIVEPLGSDPTNINTNQQHEHQNPYDYNEEHDDQQNFNQEHAGFVKFHLGVALERLGHEEEAEEIMEGLRRCEAKYACLVDSWGYIRWHTRRIDNQELNLYAGTRNMISLGLDAAKDLIQMDGLVCEFGVAQGRSLRMMQELLPLETPLHGFDTFTGLPFSWNSLPAGSFSTFGNLPNIEGDVYFHRGLFRDSIPKFLEEAGDYQSQSDSQSNPPQPLAFANIDALLYASTLDILESVHSRVVSGTVFVFADYLCHPTWRQDAFRAWRECCKRFGWSYEYLGFSIATKQVVVRVTSAH